MKLKIVSIFDSKAEVFNTPIFLPTVGMATRMFADQVNEKDSPFQKHPEDYTLFELGEYDSDSGKFENLDTPHSLGLANQYIQE